MDRIHLAGGSIYSSFRTTGPSRSRQSEGYLVLARDETKLLYRILRLVQQAVIPNMSYPDCCQQTDQMLSVVDLKAR